MIQCELCPKYCLIKPGRSGECRIRVNLNEKLTTVVYGFPCAIHIDPVEKKPLFHFLPGSKILSLATVGCNLHCRNCQNWEISQQNPEDSSAVPMSPRDLIKQAARYQCPSLAYTYTDPVVYYEYARDTAKLAKSQKLRNVLVTAAYINPKPWKQLLQYIDAANIDLKGINDDFYQKVCGATLKPVQEALVAAKEAGVMVEVTNLIIPTLNDHPGDLRKLCRWLKENMGADTPLHFSRFFPRYQMRNLPQTPPKTLDLARKIAREEGLNYVYIGNILSKQGQNTYCPKCGSLLIERSGYRVLRQRIKDGKCPDCQEKIYGVWQ